MSTASWPKSCPDPAGLVSVKASSIEKPLKYVDQDCPAARVVHVPGVVRDRDAESLGFRGHLLGEVVIGHKVRGGAHALGEQTLRDQQPYDRLPAARVHLDDEVPGVPPAPPLLENLVLRAP